MSRAVSGGAAGTPRDRWAFVLRSIRSRSRLYVATSVAAVLSVAAAALGPTFAHAAAESTLRDVLNQATASDSGLHVTPTAFNGASGMAPGDMDLLKLHAPAPGSIRGYPVAWPVERYTGIVKVSAAAGKQPTSLVWRAGACGHLVLVAGHCPTAAGQAMISARTVAAGGPGWRLGAAVQTPAGTVHVVGVYRARDLQDPYWFGVDYFTAGVDPKGLLDVDALFVTRSEMDRLPPDTELSGAIDYPLRPADIRLTDVPALRAAVQRLSLQDRPPGAVLLTTHLDQVLDLAAHQQQLVDIGTLLVTLQLALLAWLVLFLILTDVAESRGSEIALAKLRGQSRSSVVRFGLGEPLLVLLAALPVGLLLGYLAALVLSAAVLLPGTPVPLPLQAVGAAALAFAGAVVGAVLSAVRVLRRPVVEQWRRTAAVRVSRWVLVAELVVAAVAIAALVRLRTGAATGSMGGSIALLAPGLLVLAVALLGVRLMPILVRLALPATRASSRIGLFLATRQVARRPAATRLATLLAVAVGLAAFAVGGESAAALNRTARADGEVGADRVVSVGYNGTVDPVSAVRSADPDGRWAMAAATWLPDGGDTVIGTVLGVDAERLQAVGLGAAGGLPPAAVASAVTTRTVPRLEIHATRLLARISADHLRGPVPQAQFDLLSSVGRRIAAPAQTLRPGTHDYSATVPCASGCTFLGITWLRPITSMASLSGHATVHAMTATSPSGTRPVDARLTDVRAWRAAVPTSESEDRVAVTAAGVTDRFESASGYGGIAYAFVPSVLPMVTSPGGAATGKPAFGPQIADGFGASVPVRIAARTPVLPVVLDAGVVLDVAYLDDALPDFVNEASWQVWLSSAAPPDALARLQHAGLDIGPVHTAAARRAALAREGPALSFLLLLVSAVIGAVLAALGTAVAIGAGARRRSYELAATRVLGVGRRHLHAAAAGEQGILLGTAVLLGIPGGVVAALIALPILPEFAEATPIELRFVPPMLPIVLFALAFVALLTVTSLAAASAVVRAARPGRLREAEE